MNQGERNELLLKAYLCRLKYTKEETRLFGIVNNCGFGDIEYFDLQENIDLSSLSNEELINLTKDLRIEKSSPLNKADVRINDKYISIKSLSAAPPSIVNHTSRIGFKRISEQLNINISIIDNQIDNYWDLRLSEEISEDCKNDNPKSPFKDFIEDWRPYIEYFLFTGTGKGDSKFPADILLSINSFDDQSSWELLNKKECVDFIWNNLIFCMRGGKGMDKYNDPLLKIVMDPWTRFSSNKYRGALTIRYKKN